MRCSAYEGYQLQRACRVDFFSSKLPVFSFPVFPASFSLSPQGAGFPRSGPVESRSPAPLRAAPRGCAHYVVPDWGKPRGRNAPHLTDDSSPNQRQRRTAFHPAAKIEFIWKKRFLGWVEKLNVISSPSPRRVGSASSPVRPPWPGPSASATHQWPVVAPEPRPAPDGRRGARRVAGPRRDCFAGRFRLKCSCHEWVWFLFFIKRSVAPSAPLAQPLHGI